MSDAVRKQDAALERQGYNQTLKASEVEGVLGCSRQTVYSLVRSGKLSAFKLNAALRVRRHDLAHFLVVSRAR